MFIFVPVMNWILLTIAGIMEAVFAFCLGKAKNSTGNDLYFWYTCFAITLITSMALLMKAIQTLPIGTAYAVWTGIGAVGTVIVGIWIFKEPVNFWRIFFLITLIGSIAGLKAASH